MPQDLMAFVAKIFRSTAGDPHYNKWVAFQRRPVEGLYCSLFLGGWLLVLLRKKEHDGRDNPCTSLILACLVVLHISSLLSVVFQKWESVRPWLYFIIRLVLIGSLFSGVNFPDHKEVPQEETHHIVLRYLEGNALRVVACQVDGKWQVLVALAECFVAFYFSNSLFSVFPFVCWGFLEWLQTNDYDKRTQPTKGTPALSSRETCSGGSANSGTGGGCGDTIPPPNQVQPQPPVHQQTHVPKKPKVKVDISRVLRERSANGDNTPGTFFGYKPLVLVHHRTIKVHTEDASENQIQHYAAEFASNLASRQQENGKFTVVKGVGVKGCILFIAGVMEKGIEGCDNDNASNDSSIQGSAMDLIGALPEVLRKSDMDVHLDGWRAKFIKGELESCCKDGDEFEIPEVVLVSDPCAVMEGESSIDITFSESTGDWQSLQAVVILDDRVLHGEPLESNSMRVKVDWRECKKSGYIRTIGVTSEDGQCQGKTITSSMAPVLCMPKVEAFELNGLFDRTVDHAIQSAGLSPEVQRQSVWRERFKPFALDMQFILGVEGDDLRLLMSDDTNEMKWEYLTVFQRIVDFLEDCEAGETNKYLHRLFENAGIELVDGDDQTDHVVPPVQPDAGPSDSRRKPKCDDYNGPDFDTSLNVEFTFWGGFDDPAVEAQYKLHLSQNVVLVDFAGTIMGLCLLPVIWQFVKVGDHLYFCPMMTHFLVCLFWFLFSERTYIHSRQPVMILHWIVRMAVFIGQVTYKGWHSMVVSNGWNMVSLVAWLLIVRPRVMKMRVNEYTMLSLLDLSGWFCIMVISYLCGDFEAGVQSFGLALASVLYSCGRGYFCERQDRTIFASSFEIRSKPSGPK